MAKIEISANVEQAAWEKLKVMAQKTNQNISSLLTAAICEYVHQRQDRITDHLEASIRDYKDLGNMLAK